MKKTRAPRTPAKWIRSAADEAAVAAGGWFDLAAAERVRTFFAKFLRHSKGEFAGRPFELLEWEWEGVVAPLYGWKRADGTRRYRRGSIWIPKKNGKSTLAAGFVLYGLVADGEEGPEVYGGASDRSQASIIYGECAAMVRQSPALSSRLKVLDSTKHITYAAKNGLYAVLSQEARRTGHGLNASTCVIDELHVVDRKLYDTLRYAGAARRQPLLIEISTAGNDKLSLGYERYTYAKRLLKGEIEDLETFAFVAEASSNEAWEDPDEWQRANPSLGVTIRADSFAADFREAKESSPATQANFKQLRLNLWQDSYFAWLPVAEWDACKSEFDPFELLARGARCKGALDLASKLDLNAAVWAFELDEEVYLLPRFWCPAEADGRRQKANLTLLRPWIDAGLIKATPGDVADYDVIEQDILADAERFHAQELAYDPWNATQIAMHLQAAGLTLVEFPQTLRNYNEAMKEAEKLVIARKLHHRGDKVLRWNVGNVCCWKDSNGNMRPDKGKSSDKIDGFCASLMALARLILAESGTSIYENQGLDMV